MTTRRRAKQDEIVNHASLASIFQTIKERPAFEGAPELEALLTRAQTAEDLVKAGFPISPKTLATKASRGGGPPYSLFGPRPLYRWRDALIWAHRRMTPPRRSSSESDSAGEAANGQREDPHKLFATPHSKAEAEAVALYGESMTDRRAEEKTAGAPRNFGTGSAPPANQFFSNGNGMIARIAEDEL